MAVKLKPLSDRIILEPSKEAEEKSAGGIFIPDTAKEKPQTGKIVAVGPGRTNDDGKLVPVTVKVGDSVLYSKYAGTEYKQAGTEYLILRESDLLAVVG